MNVCIVGAGTAGLCSARHILEQTNWSVTIYEQSNKIGGTWVYTDFIGVDEYGLDVHSSMYQGLRTNLPKEVMGYPDFPIIGCNESYVSANIIEQYLIDYSKNYKLTEHIQFLHYVIRITPKEKSQWQVITKDLKTQKVEFHLYDYVMICNGHYHTPSYPNIKGVNKYKGYQLHSHDYRNSNRFKDETVLIIGAGPSGMDLCHEISKVAKRVTLSHHMPENPKTVFRFNVDQKPDVKYMDNYDVYFLDGSTKDYSIVFYCTGYRYSFPFLSVACGIHVDDNYVQPLYKHCLNIQYPTMALIGIPFYVCAAHMCDLQVRFVLKYWTGKKKIPTIIEMLDDTNHLMNIRFARGLKNHQAHMMGVYQDTYYDDLAKTADIKGIPSVMTLLHNESSDRFVNDLLNFRNDIFRIVDDCHFKKIN